MRLPALLSVSILSGLVACGDSEPEVLRSSVGRPPHSATGTTLDALADATPDARDTEAPRDTDTLDDGLPPDAELDVFADAGPDATDTALPPLDMPTPPPPVPPLTAAELAAVRADLVEALDVAGLAGRTFGGLVVDLDTDQTIWELDPDRVLIPASNTKIFTTASALDLLGEDYRITTRVISAGTIDGAGTLTGELSLHSEHDFTWSRWFHGSERAPLDRVAEALWRRGLRKVSGNLGVWGAYLYEGYHLGSYDPATHRARAGQAFRDALVARGIAVTGAIVDHPTLELPPGTELARWLSNPLTVAAWPINHISHNEMADILARHLGYVRAGSSDYETGGQVMYDWLTAAGVDTTGFELHDGSGLALNNRVSARHMVGLYRYMVTTSRWPAFRSTLTIAGAGGPGATDSSSQAIVTTNAAPYNGTLANRMAGADTAGRVFGKSGTNAGITTSGVLFHRYDGHRYAFAFLMNGITNAQYGTARATQDALVAAFAKDLRGRGARPAAPTLGCVAGRPGGRVEVQVQPQGDLVPQDGVAVFRVQTSVDGKRWPAFEAAEGNYFTLGEPLVLRPSGTVYVRAFAETAVGRSEPSDVYAARAPQTGNAPRVLIVDANDRWQRQPVNENPMGASHAFVVAYAEAMPAGLAFDTCPNEALTSADGLAAWDAVVWAAGEEATTDESIAAAEASLLGDYLGLGGSLFVSGAEIAWDLDPAGNVAATASDKAFLEGSLHTRYVSDDAEDFTVEGTSGGLFSELVLERRLSFWTPGQIFVAYPDELAPLAGATSCLAYTGPGTSACVQYQGEHDLVLFGFPFESIDALPERALVLGRVLGLFGVP